jgi:type IV pilus assembly protein PilE
MPSAEKENVMADFGSCIGSTAAPHRARGFTLLEVMIVVAIIGILAAIALPNYSDYIKRGKIIEATTALSDMRTRMEQFFLDNRKYDTGGVCGVDPAVVESNVKAFAVTCAIVGTGYLVTADGKVSEGMGSFTYTLNTANLRATTSVGPGWSNLNCGWVTRKDGSCS